MDNLSTVDLADVAGVSRSVIADWLDRGIISAPQAPGRGRSRVFTFRNAVEAIVAKRLADTGIRSGSIKSVMSAMQRDETASVVRLDLHGIKISIDVDRFERLAAHLLDQPRLNLA